MLNEQMTLLYPLVAIFLLLAIFVLYVYYTSDRHYRIKLLLGPTLLAACVFTVPLVGARLGYGGPLHARFVPVLRTPEPWSLAARNCGSTCSWCRENP